MYYTIYFKTILFKFVHVKIVTLGNTADCTETFEIPGTSTGLEGRGSGLETRPIVTGWVVCWLKLRRDSKCKQSWLENVYFWNLKFTNFNILRKPRCLPNFTKRCKKMQKVDTYKYRRLKFTLTSCIYIFWNYQTISLTSNFEMYNQIGLVKFQIDNRGLLLRKQRSSSPPENPEFDTEIPFSKML